MSPEEIVVLAIAAGIVVSFAFSEIYGLAAGGVVVPGYIAIYFHRPAAIAVTLAIAVISFAVVKALATFLIVYGRRRTALHILVAFAFGSAVKHTEVLETLGDGAWQRSDMTVIGYIIPGLIAIWFDRQGVLPTISSLAIAATVVRLFLLLVAGHIAVQGAV